MNPYNKYILLLFTGTRKGAPGPRRRLLARLASSANSTSCFLWSGWVTSSYVITDETTKKLVLDKIVSGIQWRALVC